MLRTLILFVIWVGFTIYTVWLASIDQPYTWFVGQNLLTLQWQKLNAFIPALFWLMYLSQHSRRVQDRNQCHAYICKHSFPHRCIAKDSQDDE